MKTMWIDRAMNFMLEEIIKLMKELILCMANKMLMPKEFNKML